MKNLIPAFTVLLFAIGLQAQEIITENMIRQIAPHPRLLLKEGEEQHIKNAIARDKTFAELNNALLLAAESYIPKKNINEGSQNYREALKRLFLWSYAYRMTLESRYAQRAEQEMLNIANFNTWPGEYITIAELTIGMSIGYDWVYNTMSVSSREKIANAIIEKGIRPSFGTAGYHFLHAVSNWNLVGNAGVSVGAIATAETNPQLCIQTLNRTFKSLYMKQYAPNGIYPEGYGYWGYGTNNIVLLIHALETALGSDFGLSQSEGFMNTASFLLHMTGNNNKCFNFSDTKVTPVINPAVFWFATKNKDLSLLWNEQKTIKQLGYKECVKYRMSPLIMIWGNTIDMKHIPEPSSTFYVAKEGVTPVALMRSSWKENGIYLGMKGGCPQAGHGHMDIGSFIVDADGERWITDLGAPKYTEEYFRYVDADEESKRILLKPGIEYLKVPAQDSPRWQTPQASALYHNLVTVDQEEQYVKGYATYQKIIHTDSLQSASIDLASLYPEKLAKYERTGAIISNAYIRLNDELQAADKAITTRWTVITDATISVIDDKHIQLKKNGKSMTMKIITDKDIQLIVSSLSIEDRSSLPINKYSSISFFQKLQASEKQAVEVLFIPGSSHHCTINKSQR